MTDAKLDFEAADKFAGQTHGGQGDGWPIPKLANLARCYRASREREKRLEALVRGLLENGTFCGVRSPSHPWNTLVEAARKELADGK